MRGKSQTIKSFPKVTVPLGSCAAMGWGSNPHARTISSVHNGHEVMHTRFFMLFLSRQKSAHFSYALSDILNYYALVGIGCVVPGFTTALCITLVVSQLATTIGMVLRFELVRRRRWILILF